MTNERAVLRVFKCERSHISLVPQAQVDTEPPTRCPCDYGVPHERPDNDGRLVVTNRCDSPLRLLDGALTEVAK